MSSSICARRAAIGLIFCLTASCGGSADSVRDCIRNASRLKILIRQVDADPKSSLLIEQFYTTGGWRRGWVVDDRKTHFQYDIEDGSVFVPNGTPDGVDLFLLTGVSDDERLCRNGDLQIRLESSKFVHITSLYPDTRYSLIATGAG